MKKLSYLAAAAAISGLALVMTPASASPLASGLMSGNSAVPQLGEDLVQNVHGWHCRWRRGHRHRRACYDDDFYYGSPFAFGFPFFAFSFYDDDDDDFHWRGHRRHHKWRHHGHRKWKRHGGHRKWKRKHW